MTKHLPMGFLRYCETQPENGSVLCFFNATPEKAKEYLRLYIGCLALSDTWYLSNKWIKKRPRNGVCVVIK